MRNNGREHKRSFVTAWPTRLAVSHAMARARVVREDRSRAHEVRSFLSQFFCEEGLKVLLETGPILVNPHVSIKEDWRRSNSCSHMILCSCASAFCVFGQSRFLRIRANLLRGSCFVVCTWSIVSGSRCRVSVVDTQAIANCRSRERGGVFRSTARVVSVISSSPSHNRISCSSKRPPRRDASSSMGLRHVH
jgi:hypothetical protein